MCYAIVLTQVYSFLNTHNHYCSGQAISCFELRVESRSHLDNQAAS